MKPPDAQLLERVRAALIQHPGPVTPGRVAGAVRSAGVVLGDVGLLEVAESLRAELVGAGPLEQLLKDPDVTDVLVNGSAGVWVDRGRGVERVRLDLGGEHAVRQLAVRLAAVAGRRLDDACPYVDARLASGLRVHAILPPLVEGTHLSLRVPRRRSFTLAGLVQAALMPSAWSSLLHQLVLRRTALLITGGTGTGKTTVLATLLGLVPPGERLVVVEDSAELRIEHPHVVQLQSRLPNVEGSGAVTMAELVRQAMRMRPDRLVIGEVRGAEVRELLAALNTGHEGGCGTLHANAVADVPARLEALGSLAAMEPAAVQAQARAAVQAVLHLQRVEGVRRLVEIGVVDPHGAGLQVDVALRAEPGDPAHPGHRGPGWPLLAARLG